VNDELMFESLNLPCDYSLIGQMPPLTAAQKRQKEKDKKKRQKELDQAREEHALHDLANGTPGQRKEAELIHISKQLAALHRDVVEVPADGDCLFHALAHQHGAGMTALDMRALLVEYIRAHKEDYSAFVEAPEGTSTDDPFESYCVSMGKNGTWGTALEVRAAADCFHVTIAMITATNVSVCGAVETPASSAQWAVIFYQYLYTLGCHFNATSKRSDVIADDEDS
jgi:hypothetical protein